MQGCNLRLLGFQQMAMLSAHLFSYNLIPFQKLSSPHNMIWPTICVGSENWKDNWQLLFLPFFYLFCLSFGDLMSLYLAQSLCTLVPLHLRTSFFKLKRRMVYKWFVSCQRPFHNTLKKIIDYSLYTTDGLYNIKLVGFHGYKTNDLIQRRIGLSQYDYLYFISWNAEILFILIRWRQSTFSEMQLNTI